MAMRDVGECLLAAVCCLSGLASRSSQAAGPAWYLKLVSSSRSFLVSEDGTDRRIVGDSVNPDRSRNVSPDGRWALYVDAANGDAELFRMNLATQAIVKLTDNTASDDDPVWAPDGRQIAFSSNRSGQWQVYLMNSDGSNVKQRTAATLGARKPKLGAMGQLAYVRMITGTGRDQLVDLAIEVGGEARTVLGKRRVTCFAWSPDGKLLAVGELTDEGGKIDFIEWATGKVNQIDLRSKVDARLDWHSAVQIHWRPDGRAIGCRLAFSGSRMAGGARIFGDEEIFVISLDGRARWFEFGEGDVQIVGWERAGDKGNTRLDPVVRH